ncbi:hypothetical protein N7519_003705 [Penicillium mononematosum]|uniref:uncharacterized protein n=1 Tax=Penicillium mononematosum TaxID=268346 RepID=UPI002548EC8B|nr:uncharacterized protein N7519_003705 [Penicillium mononematosum]KAJ6188797.1 hypothetical protein N7519_003705 [Penicillium mononematosum]
MASAKSSSAPRSGSSGLTKSYLFTYNTLNLLAWGTCVVYTASLLPAHVSNQTLPKVFGQTFSPLLLATQSLALLEVVHSIVGLVRAPFMTTAMQVSSRLLLVWGIMAQFGGEIVGAGQDTQLGDYAYLGYNTFYVFYPVGISSECALIFQALGPAGELSPLFRYLLIAILVIYVPGSYILYTHMIAQRRKIMRGKKRAD